MIVYHVAMKTADDYLRKREPHRAAHLERLVGLRSHGLVIGGGQRLLHQFNAVSGAE